MGSGRCFSLAVGLFILFSSLPFALGAERPRAFGPGERLVYDISYMGMSAGTAVMEVKEAIWHNGRVVYPVVSTAQSNDMVSLFYPVNDRVESLIDADAIYSHRIDVKQHQGKKRREKVIDFDQSQHLATQYRKEKKEVFSIPAEVQDSLSSLYFFRNQPLPRVGQSIFIPVHESEKNWNLEIRLLGRERLTTPVGAFNTIKVQALLRYKGIFLDEGDVWIWMTDDPQHLPVKINSTIKIGTINAVLISRRSSPVASPPTTSGGTLHGIPPRATEDASQ
jgi:hypothetical protein